MDREPPLSVYRARIHAFGADVARFARWDGALGWARLAVFLAAIAALAFAVKRGASPAWPVAAVAAFVLLVLFHARVVRLRDRSAAAAALNQAGVDRIEDRWAGKGDDGERFRAAAADHLYAEDMDLFGKGGLFELLSVARTPIGQSTLAGWLQAGAAPAVVRARQDAVAELADMVDWRQDFSLAAPTLADEVRDEALLAWAQRPPTGLPRALGPWRIALAVASAATVVAIALFVSGVAPAWAIVPPFLAGTAMSVRLRGAVAQVLQGIDRRADELRALAGLMARVERQSFQSDAMRALARALETSGVPPSRRIAGLRRLVDLVENRRNQLAGILMGTVQATAQLALAIEAWRRRFGDAVGKWMSAVGEVEALSSLATLRFEHPELPFPTIIDDPTPDGPRFEAEAMGHPLIPAARRVCNDLRLGGARRLVLVSGSNMSGKSTLLRTVGVNVVLALCGAPVFARRLTLTPVTLGATLRINDSLQDGKSRFYAELVRLRQIVDRAGQEPQLLYLLDEILHGTNSHDRRAGAEALIRGLIQRGAVGLVTTHDLALAAMAEELGARAANIHFEDDLRDGKMTFDYRIKEGVVRKSNALELMRAVGLNV